MRRILLSSISHSIFGMKRIPDKTFCISKKGSGRREHYVRSRQLSARVRRKKLCTELRFSSAYHSGRPALAVSLVRMLASGNGRRTRLLWDSWLFEQPLCRVPTFICSVQDLSSCGVDMLVRDGSWDFERLDSLFGPDLIARILCINLPSEDTWCWVASHDGVARPSSAYRLISLHPGSLIGLAGTYCGI